MVDAAPEMPRGGGGGDEKHSGGKRKKKDDATDAVSPEDGTDGKTLGERARDAERGFSTKSTRGDADANDALAGAIGDALGDAFDAETKAAWVAVYGIVQKTMIGDNYN